MDAEEARTYKILVDETLIGMQIEVVVAAPYETTPGQTYPGWFRFYDSNGNLIGEPPRLNNSGRTVLTIPTGTVCMGYRAYDPWGNNDRLIDINIISN